jgi:hypothetical protein
MPETMPGELVDSPQPPSIPKPTVEPKPAQRRSSRSRTRTEKGKQYDDSLRRRT